MALPSKDIVPYGLRVEVYVLKWSDSQTLKGMLHPKKKMLKAMSV
jgi:hypothetical protein